jgi:RNA ligase
MKLYDYIPEALLMQRIGEGYVNVNHHKKFPLAIYTYSKSATYDYVWDEATCKCRGLIVDLTNMEIIARPMQKFFNVGERAGITREQFPAGACRITDKLDGNLITLYNWLGTWYAASKGSFHSEHADWANNWLKTNETETEFNHFSRSYVWPDGYTPVFEMIAEELEHHVVHYGKELSGLYLIALIDNATGEELNHRSKAAWAAVNNVAVIPESTITLDEALRADEKNAEGYVVSWARTGQTPLRVKIKFPDFLRLQKLVHNVGPKEILDYLRRPELKCYLDEVLDPERSHPEFIKYVRAWMERFVTAYYAVQTTAAVEMTGLRKFLQPTDSRKDWAEKIKQCQYPAIMFAMLDEDSEEMRKQIWKRVEPVAEQTDDVRSIITQEE